VKLLPIGAWGSLRVTMLPSDPPLVGWGGGYPVPISPPPTSPRPLASPTPRLRRLKFDARHVPPAPYNFFAPPPACLLDSGIIATYVHTDGQPENTVVPAPSTGRTWQKTTYSYENGPRDNRSAQLSDICVMYSRSHATQRWRQHRLQMQARCTARYKMH